jgi:hypothetical protein
MAISYHTISYRVISYHTISYHIIPYHTISYYIIPYHMFSYMISYHFIWYIGTAIPTHALPSISEDLG